jgi:starvation-inducible DNA-binding protein
MRGSSSLPATVAAKAAATQVPAGFTQWEDMIRGVIADMDAVLIDVKAAIDGLDEVDLASQDVAITIRESLDKDRWFLFAHLAE